MIYVVTGAQGQYSDYTHWTIKAFKSKKKAEEYAKILNDIEEKKGEKYYWRTWYEVDELDFDESI